MCVSARPKVPQVKFDGAGAEKPVSRGPTPNRRGAKPVPPSQIERARFAGRRTRDRSSQDFERLGGSCACAGINPRMRGKFIPVDGLIVVLQPSERVAKTACGVLLREMACGTHALSEKQFDKH